MRKVYLDSAPVIYFVEQTPLFYSRVRALLQPSDWLVVSELTRFECRIVPIRTGNSALLRDFDEFFADYVDEVVALTREVEPSARLGVGSCAEQEGDC